MVPPKRLRCKKNYCEKTDHNARATIFLFLAHQQQILFKMCVISSLHVISRNAANMKESEGDVCFSSHFKARGNHNGHFGRQ